MTQVRYAPRKSVRSILMTPAPRKIRTDLTKEELDRLEKYGSLEFKSAGAKRTTK